MIEALYPQGVWLFVKSPGGKMENVRRMIIAPNYRQTVLFAMSMGWSTSSIYNIATTPEHLLGLRLEKWEVWWLDRMWPCRTHEEVEYMKYMKRLAKSRGADLHRWWT